MARKSVSGPVQIQRGGVCFGNTHVITPHPSRQAATPSPAGEGLSAVGTGVFFELRITQKPPMCNMLFDSTGTCTLPAFSGGRRWQP